MIHSEITAEQALIFWGWKTKNELSKMNNANKRNALIVGLKKISSHSIPELQKFRTQGKLKSLVGLAFISVFLKSNRRKTTNELASMAYGDQRNTLIVQLKNFGGYDTPYLQGLGDLDLFYIGSKLNPGNQWLKMICFLPNLNPDIMI